MFQKGGSGDAGWTRTAIGRPVQRLLQDSGEDVMSWTRAVAGKGVRNGWVLTLLWKAESTRFLDRLEGGVRGRKESRVAVLGLSNQKDIVTLY